MTLLGRQHVRARLQKCDDPPHAALLNQERTFLNPCWVGSRRVPPTTKPIFAGVARDRRGADSSESRDWDG